MSGRLSRQVSKASQLADQLGNASLNDKDDLVSLVNRLVEEQLAKKQKTKVGAKPKLTAQEKKDLKEKKEFEKKVEDIIGNVVSIGSAIKLKEEQKKGTAGGKKRKLYTKADRTEFVSFAYRKWMDYFTDCTGDGGDPVQGIYEWKLENMDITSRTYNHDVALDFFDVVFLSFTKQNGKDSIDLESCSQHASLEMGDE